MKLEGSASYFEPGLGVSLRAMHLQTEILGILSDNFTGLDKPGYQKKTPVVSSFSEYVGAHALSTVVDDEPGRIVYTKNPLDFALSSKGYFRTLGAEGVSLTRDGRFSIDKDGNLLNVKNEKVLAADGTPVVFPFAPENPEDVVVDLSGKVSILNRNKQKLEYVADLGIVTKDGTAVLEPSVRQGFTEDSNVDVMKEVFEYMPISNNFRANKQMFSRMNNMISSAVQTLSNM